MSCFTISSWILTTSQLICIISTVVKNTENYYYKQSETRIMFEKSRIVEKSKIKMFSQNNYIYRSTNS